MLLTTAIVLLVDAFCDVFCKTVQKKFRKLLTRATAAGANACLLVKIQTLRH